MVTGWDLLLQRLGLLLVGSAVAWGLSAAAAARCAPQSFRRLLRLSLLLVLLLCQQQWVLGQVAASQIAGGCWAALGAAAQAQALQMQQQASSCRL